MLKSWSFRASVALATAALLGSSQLASTALANSQIKEISFEQYLEQTNDMIDSVVEFPDKSTDAAKEIFNLPQIAQMRYKNGRALCLGFNAATKDGKLTKKELQVIVNTVWRNERQFVDRASASGWSNDELDGMMLVNFTTIAMGVFTMCPHHTDLMSGRFSDSLYKIYRNYID